MAAGRPGQTSASLHGRKEEINCVTLHPFTQTSDHTQHHLSLSSLPVAMQHRAAYILTTLIIISSCKGQV